MSGIPDYAKNIHEITPGEVQQRLAINQANREGVYRSVQANLDAKAPAHCIAADLLTGYDKAAVWEKDCRKGCSYCCNQPVVASPPEIFLLADALRHTYKDEPAELADIIATLKAHSEKTAPYKDTFAYRAAKIPCPLLNDGNACSVHGFHPLVCRSHTSLDVQACKRQYEVTDFTTPEITNFRELAMAIYSGMSQCLKANGLKSKEYNFIPALIIALEDPTCEQRWKDGRNPFPNCRPRLTTTTKAAP